ncbi:MAG TPA: Tad domain-containing protein [Sphingomonas sp.]|nr:Tad domain-containing protein [Sphingomonas sp.]
MRRLRRSASGNILVVAGASMPLVIGAGGLAVDTIQWTEWKRELQREADSASLAGAYALAQTKSVSASATADLSRTGQITLSTTPTIESPPSTGSYAGNTTAVRVALQTSRALPFTSMFLSVAPTIGAQATAAVVSNGNYCMLALDRSTNVGVTLQGNATVDLQCGIASNSMASNAVYAGGSASVTATPVAAVGGLSPSNNYVSPTTLLPYSIPQSDPFASLPTPTATNLASCQSKATVGPNSSATLSPGCYQGMDLKGTVTLNPGVYYIDGSSLSIGSQAIVTGAGVTIVLTSSTAATSPSSIATVSINGSATLNLTAPTSGTYSGVLMYQDRRAVDSGGSNANQINGNASSTLQGAFYFPSQQMTFNGTYGMTTKCVQIVAKDITFSGNSKIDNTCPGGQGGWVGTRVQLVG